LRGEPSRDDTLDMAEPPLPTLIVVSGPPGAGKTTLAHALANEIPCPAICRDEIKEGMAHSQPGDFHGELGDPLTVRTVPLFFEVLRVLLAGGVTVVAEAAFQDRVWRPGLEPLTELAQIRIVQCHVDHAVSYERAVRRGAESEHRRKAHGDSTIGRQPEEWAHAFESFDRVSVSAPSIDVDTTDGYEPDLPAIVEFVNRA
jgi:predicted kinase